jgi:hypothetical protein
MKPRAKLLPDAEDGRELIGMDRMGLKALDPDM